MALVEHAVVLYQPQAGELLERVKEFSALHHIHLHLVSLEHFRADPARYLEHAKHVVALVDDTELADLVSGSRQYEYSVGIIPLHRASFTYRLFCLPSSLEKLLECAFDEAARAMDVLLCNDEVVMGMLMVGDSPLLDRSSKTYLAEQSGLLQRWWHTFMLLIAGLVRLPRIRHFPVTLTTAKEQQIKTAVTGITVIENDTTSLAARLVNTTVSAEDGKASVLLISPKSIGEYLRFLFRALFPWNHSVKALPGAVSYIRSSRLTIEGKKPLVYYLDGKQRQAEQLELEVCRKAVRICVGERWCEEQAPVAESPKDTLRVENLPVHTERLAMITRRLPLFTHALEEEFKELFLLLKQHARVEVDYVALMILSTLVASLGLFMNSSAVLIGAMLLAPLMAPIISLAMGLLRNDQGLLRGSVKSILIGMLIALVTSALVAILVPLQRVTPEIAARLQPSLFDLGVAIASGIAGGYAYAREKVMKSLPGVAIAVALVPPLCVAGFGIGWHDLGMVLGASLLFLTNLVGIALATAITFLVLGFSPISRPTQGAKSLVLSLVLTLLVAVPLSVSFSQMHQAWLLETSLSSEVFAVNGKQLWLSDIQVSQWQDGVQVSGNLSSPVPLDEDDVRALKEELQERLQQPVRLEVGYRIQL